MNQTRLPRFQRSAEVRPLDLTERDRAILRLVSEHRFLRSTHLVRLLPGSRQQLLRRLQLLFHHGYLERPRAQIDYYRIGSRAMVYGLGSKALSLDENIQTASRRKLEWIVRNRAITRYFMEHTLAVADVMVAVELSCREHGLKLLRPEGASDRVTKWNVPVPSTGTSEPVGVIPDQVFGLECSKGVHWFFVEADRATMPVCRNTFKQTSFARKLLAYRETWRQKKLEKTFGRFQVLTVTTTSERAKNLAEATFRATEGSASGLFLFTDRSALARSNDIFSLKYLNGRAEQVTLVV